MPNELESESEWARLTWGQLRYVRMADDDYYPYACAPYGFYGPEWFSGGVFSAPGRGAMAGMVVGTPDVATMDAARPSTVTHNFAVAPAGTLTVGP